MKEIKLHDRVFVEAFDEICVERAVDKVAENLLSMHMPLTGRPLFMVVLDGAFMFASALLQKMDVLMDIKFVKLKSYEGTESTGVITEVLGFSERDVQGRDVIIVEDIVDTGRTIDYLNKRLITCGAKSVTVSCMVYKPSKYKGDKLIDAVGISMDDQFVVGFGLDYDGLGRNLPTIYVEKK